MGAHDSVLRFVWSSHENLSTYSYPTTGLSLFHPSIPPYNSLGASARFGMLSHIDLYRPYMRCCRSSTPVFRPILLAEFIQKRRVDNTCSCNSRLSTSMAAMRLFLNRFLVGVVSASASTSRVGPFTRRGCSHAFRLLPRLSRLRLSPPEY